MRSEAREKGSAICAPPSSTARVSRDFATRELLSDILDNEEDAVDYIETQLELIKLTGLENYIQLQSDSAKS